MIGCAFIAKNVEEFGTVNAIFIRNDCAKPAIRMALVELYDDSYDLNFSDLSKNEIVISNKKEYKDNENEKILIENILSSEKFSLGKNDKDYLVFDFGLRHAESNWGVTWITFITAGLIPTYHSGIYQMNLKVFLRTENLLLT